MLEMEGWSPLLDKGVGPMGLARVAPQGRGGLPRPQGTVKAEFLLRSRTFFVALRSRVGV